MYTLQSIITANDEVMIVRHEAGPRHTIGRPGACFVHTRIMSATHL